MQPQMQPVNVPVYHLLVVRPEPSGHYTAQAVGLPDVQATAGTREEAIQQVRSILTEWLAAGQLVQVELPQKNPLMKWLGWAKDDPDFDLYVEEIRRYREEVDRREQPELEQRRCSDSSSTPTT